jgi:uncharacterized membrane protein YphA (DoxX/SURF4 family)
MLNGFQILNPIPDLLMFSALAPFILRIVLGFIIVNSGNLKLKLEKTRWITTMQVARIPNEALAVAILGTVEIVAGIMLVIGFYTQVAALLVALISFVCLYVEYKEDTLVKRDVPFYLLTLAIALSLLFTGAGAFSFDLPL